MDYQKFYQQAKKEGYSDEEATNYLLQNDPSFEEFIKQSKDEGYSPEEVLGYLNSAPKQKEMDSNDYATDVAKQGAQGFGIGALGTYGDILDLFGIQPKETLPGEKAKYGRESDILQKMQEGGTPSVGELLELSDEDISPRFSRLPGSQDIQQFGKQLGLVSEPKSAAGRYARRIGKFGGGGASLGGGGILAPIVAGAAGQTLEEMGAPPWLQATAEIIAGLKAAPKSKVPISSESKEVEKVIGDLRKAGYSDQDITLAKNALEERKILKKFATLTPKAENAIQQGLKNSEQLFKEQIKKGLPGYAEGGLPYLEKQASNVYQSMEELASNIPIRNKEPVKKSIQNAIAYLEKYPLLDEQKKFIEFMKDGLSKVDKAGTAEFFTGFYRNLGKAGNWGDPKQKEHLLGLVKEGIKDTFAQSGPEAAKFGKYFDKTNEVWKHWLNARDLMETIEKAQNVDGMNFKKIAGILNDPKNHELAKKVLGQEQLENIKTITKGADAIESIMKQIKPTDETSKAIKSLEAIRAFLTGSWKTFAGIMGLSASKSLSTSFLFDPKKQNMMKKLIIAAKNNAPQQAAILAQELTEEVDFEPSKNRSAQNKR
jgi:hypothetical protein